jgi:hypothetical protein
MVEIDPYGTAAERPERRLRGPGRIAVTGRVAGWSAFTNPSRSSPHSRAETATRYGGSSAAERGVLVIGTTITVEERRMRSDWTTTAG